MGQRTVMLCETSGADRGRRTPVVACFDCISTSLQWGRGTSRQRIQCAGDAPRKLSRMRTSASKRCCRGRAKDRVLACAPCKSPWPTECSLARIVEDPCREGGRGNSPCIFVMRRCIRADTPKARSCLLLATHEICGDLRAS